MRFSWPGSLDHHRLFTTGQLGSAHRPISNQVQSYSSWIVYDGTAWTCTQSNIKSSSVLLIMDCLRRDSLDLHTGQYQIKFSLTHYGLFTTGQFGPAHNPISNQVQSYSLWIVYDGKA